MGKLARLNSLGFLGKTKLRLVSKIFPVKRGQILLLDKIEINLQKAKVSLIHIPSVSSPQITSDFCFIKPVLTEIKTAPPYVVIVTCKNINCFKRLRVEIDEKSVGKKFKFVCPSCNYAALYTPTKDELIEDFTKWFKDQLLYPGIESFFLILNPPKKVGKSYRKVGPEDMQPTLFNHKDEKCIHGLQKSSCSICVQKERREQEGSSTHVDPFDLIFPILQPPLGENFDSPIAFPSDLYPFQREGIKFLTDNERALLADEMGLGKSVQAAVAIRFLVRLGKVTTGVILCPKSVLSDWERRLSEWAPELRIVKVRGTKEQREISWNTPAHLYLTTYETLRQDLSASIKELNENDGDGDKDIARKQFDLVVLDEIQRIKNPGTDISKATRKIEAKFRWGLSGTPLENRLEELISIFAYLKPGLLHYDDSTKPSKVKQTIKPYFLRRRKADALPDLPDKVCEEAWLELLPAQREAYEKAEREGIVALNEQGDSVTVTHILALITKLKQICNIEPSSKESCKLEYLLEKLEEISEQDEKVLIFSQYPSKTLKLLEPELRQFNPKMYDGSLSDSTRDRIINEFQEREENKLLLMSVKAGGLGITLTRANHVYHFDLWWNPSVASQAEDRAHRIGQEKTVFVTSLFAINTIEEKIQNLLDKKRKLFKEVIDDLSDTNLSKLLTEDELFGLFGLQKPRRSPTTSTNDGGFVTLDLLANISYQQFERLTAEVFERMGYRVKLTPPTKDKGVDIYATRQSESGTEYLAIQCKHYPNSKVGVEHARSLYGVIHDQQSFTKGLLVTSGEFSRECREFAGGKRIDLFDGVYLCGLIAKYKISLKID